jgi:hypothetical protein
MDAMTKRANSGSAEDRRQSAPSIPSEVVPSVIPEEMKPGAVTRELRAIVDAGARIVPAGEARRDPERLLTGVYRPRHKFTLFDASYYLADVRQNPDVRFLVAYVVLGAASAHKQRVYPRIFYKDASLAWRSASHYVHSDEENWIGKGDLKRVVENSDEQWVSDEATTDLPLEIQNACELTCRRASRIPRDNVALDLILRRGPDDRLEPYRDFTEPRRRASSNPRNRVNGGRSIAVFTRKNDPSSLRFARGFEPDLDRGIVEVSGLSSRLYGGPLDRYRVVSSNQKVQYQFIVGPRQVWIPACQATTTEIMSYGLRTIDANVDDDLLLPAFEYHFMDDSQDPPTLYSQIPEGFVGATSDVDPHRADASPWLEEMPIIQAFRRKVLGGRRGR